MPSSSLHVVYKKGLTCDLSRDSLGLDPAAIAAGHRQGVTMSVFSKITNAPPIEVLEMKRKHDEDDSPRKINLTVGGYKVI